jgi:hypothetical protein
MTAHIIKMCHKSTLRRPFNSRWRDGSGLSRGGSSMVEIAVKFGVLDAGHFSGKSENQVKTQQ